MEINDTSPQATLETIFKENDFYYDYDCTSNPWTAEIRVTYGDWKHDHQRLMYVMEQNGFTLVDRVIEPSDDDCYTCTYTYQL